MHRYLKKALCVVFVVLVLAASFPLDAFAVDPVSSSVLANALAQAISAYGAANGVGVVFDVADADGIGENMHELWKRFRAGQQTTDDYLDIAALMWPDLYIKTSVVADAACVGVHVASTYAEQFDNFYNWLLSGPAEMVKVDNQYFHFSQSQIGPFAQPIICGSMVSYSAQVPYGADYSVGLVSLSYASSYIKLRTTQNEYPVVAFAYPNGYEYRIVCVSSANVSCVASSINSSTGNMSGSKSASTNNYNSTSSVYYSSTTTLHYSQNGATVNIPYYSSFSEGLAASAQALGAPSVGSSVGVKAYNLTGIADFPDTADPNYDALNRARDIPLDQPWDYTKYGDGSGTLTDAQTGAIAGDLDGVIERDKELALAGDNVTNPPNDDDPTSSNPHDYLVLGLEDVFPFCIPFDIYNFLSALVAAPTAPHFTATLAFPAAVGGNQTIEIDFDNPTFNQLAQLLRTLELLAFIVGLALLTRSMFIRG